MLFQMSLLSDLHLRATEPYDSPGHKRLEEKLDALQYAVRYAAENRHDLLVLAGDMFHHLHPPDWLRAKFVECLKPCLSSETHTHVYTLIGNHETNGKTHAFETLSALSKVYPDKYLHVVDQPRVIYREPSIGIDMLPYMKTAQTLEAISKSQLVEGVRTKILIGHLSVEGAALSGGNAYQIPTILRPHHFSGYDLVVLGHIHQRQVHINDSLELTWSYGGSPVYQDFGEVNDQYPKGFCEVTVEADDEHNDPRRVELSPVEIQSTPFKQIEVTEEGGWNTELQRNIKGSIAKVLLVGSQDFLKSKEAQTLRKTLRDLERKGWAKKIITETKCTDRQLLEAVEEPAELKVDDALERLCKEKNREAFLPDGQRFMEEADNALAGHSDR